MSDKELLLLTIPQAAEWMGVSTHIVRVGVENGTLPRLRVGNRWMIPYGQLKKLVGPQP